jgi:hypothetical protein
MKFEEKEKEIKQLNEEIKQATLGTGEYKNISDEKCSKIVVKLEAQLAELKADKDRWFNLVEEEKMNEFRNNTLDTSHSPIQGTILHVHLFLILEIPHTHSKRLRGNWSVKPSVPTLKYDPHSSLFLLDSEYLEDSGLPYFPWSHELSLKKPNDVPSK